MRASGILRLLASLTLAAINCGCMSTSFEAPPVAAQACDASLVGAWQSVDKSGQPDGEMWLQVASDCGLQVRDLSAGKQRTGEATVLSTARRAGQSYAWINVGWASRRFQFKELAPDSPDFLLFRYSIQGKQLQLQMVNHSYVAHQIIDGGIPGTVHKDENTLINRVTGPARPELLDRPGLFATDDIALFQREDAAP